jgi:hypothetical protein
MSQRKDHPYHPYQGAVSPMSSQVTTPMTEGGTRSLYHPDVSAGQRAVPPAPLRGVSGVVHRDTDPPQGPRRPTETPLVDPGWDPNNRGQRYLWDLYLNET